MVEGPVSPSASAPAPSAVPARPAAPELFHVVATDDKDVVLPAVEALAALDLPEVDDVLRRLRDGDDAWLSITAGWLLTDRSGTA